MYSAFRLAQKFISYLFKASNGKGHGVHSPFVFELITKVLKDKDKYPVYAAIEGRRNALLLDERMLTIEDFGAGSVTLSTNSRPVKKIASSSLKPAKYSQLMYRIVRYYKPNTIIELGTSLGITTAYLALANPGANVLTLEGSPEIATIAKETFTALQIPNIELTVGNFDNTLQQGLMNLPTVDLAFVDGNHRKIPTLYYFEQLLKKKNEQSIFILDDIHWSREMEEAWAEIKCHPSVTFSIDLFFIGIVFFRKEIKVKQHFTIRF